jgi:hypothetical protein
LTNGEVELRRNRALQLRLAGLGESEIAEWLCVSAATISRDLKDIQEGWGRQFRDEFDVVRELAEAVALYSLLEGAAVRELMRLEAEADSGASAKTRCILAAGAMRSRRVELLAAAGLMSATELRPQGALPTPAPSGP